MNIKDIKEQVSIVDFLQKIGIESKRTRSGETWYVSPIRSSDTDASFSVNDNSGKWFDFGEGIGGNIIDLGLHIFETKDVATVVEKFNQLYGEGYKYQHKQPRIPKLKKKVHDIISIKNIGNNIALTNYIAARGVLNAARQMGFLREVYYNFLPDNMPKRRFFGVGWENRSGGFDVRSKYGKICIDNKDLFYKEGITDKVMIFEGMFDALTAIELNRDLENNHLIVLNSLSMLNNAVELVEKRADQIHNTELYLDHGQGGRKMTEQFKLKLPSVVDKSNLYLGFDDYNDKLVSDLSKKKDAVDR